MFTPKAFKEADFKIMQAFIKEQPQATVIAQTSNGMEACHIPMYWQDDGSKFGCLYGHIAKVNTLNSSANLAAPWLIIFQDAGHYITHFLSIINNNRIRNGPRRSWWCSSYHLRHGLSCCFIFNPNISVAVFTHPCRTDISDKV